MVRMAMSVSVPYEVVAGVTFTGWSNANRQTLAVARMRSFHSSRLGFSDVHASFTTHSSSHQRRGRRGTGRFWRSQAAHQKWEGVVLLPFKRSDARESRLGSPEEHPLFRAISSAHQRRGNRGTGRLWRSNATHQWEEGVVDGTSMPFRRLYTRESSRFGSFVVHPLFRANSSAHRRLGRTGPGGCGRSRAAHQKWEGAVADGTSMPFKITDDARESSGEESSGARAESVGNVGTTRFFYDELQEAAALLKEQAHAVKSSDSLLLPAAVEEEGAPQLKDNADSEELLRAEGTSETVNWTSMQDFDMSRPGKLPIESNGPPMVVLQPYLAPDNSPEKPNERLRCLPLPMPHKLRPLGLPRPKLYHRLGIVSPTKSMPAAVVGDFTLRSLAQEIRALPTKRHASQILNKWIWQLKRGSLAKTVRELGRMELTERALQVLSWMQKCPHLWPDDTTLSTLIQVLVEAGEVDTASEVQRTVGRDSVKAAKALAHALARAGMFIEAVEVLNRMKQAGWKIDGSVHAKLIESACHTRERDFVESLLRDTDFLQLKLKLQDYTTIVASCSKLGLVDEAESVYRQFKVSGLQPDIVIYTALLLALTRAGKHHEAVALFRDIKKARCTPDLVAYQVMLEASAKLGDLDMTLGVFHDFKNAGFDPSPKVYDTLVQLHHKLGLTSMAKDFMVEMQSKGFAPSAETLTCLSTNATV